MSRDAGRSASACLWLRISRFFVLKVKNLRHSCTVVGVGRFELPIFWSQTRRLKPLGHTPKKKRSNGSMHVTQGKPRTTG